MKNFFRFLILSQLTAPAFAADAPTSIIADPNGNVSIAPDVVSIAASDATPAGERLLVWTDAASQSVYVQLVDAETNVTIGNVARLSNPAMTFSHSLPASNGNPGPAMTYSVQAGSTPGQPRVYFHPDAGQWLVMWPAALHGSDGDASPLIGNHLIGLTVTRSASGLTLGDMRHLNGRWNRNFGDEEFYGLADGQNDSAFDVLFDPAQSRYILVWSSRRDGATANQISGCLLDITALPQNACNGDLISGITSTQPHALGIQLDVGGSPDQLYVVFSRLNNGANSVAIKRINADLSEIEPALDTHLGATRDAWINVHLDASRDRILIVGTNTFLQPSLVTSIPFSTFPTGAPVADRLVDNVAMSFWQPYTHYFSEADVFVIRSESPNEAPHWSAFDAGYTPGTVIPQTPYTTTSGFLASGELNRRRSVLVQNNAAMFSMIGRSATDIEIVGTQFTPYRADHGVSATSIDAPWLHGDTATFGVTLDNRTPEDGLEKLAVAHDIVLRLTFSDAAIIPVINDGICSSLEEQEDGAWLCRLQNPMHADELLEFDVTADTSVLSGIPVEGITLGLTIESSTISNDPVSENNTATVDVVVMPSADPGLATLDGDNGIGIVGGEDFALDFVVSNQGLGTATGVALNLVLPEGVTLATATGCTPSGTIGEVNCTGIPDVAPGEAATVSMSFTTEAVTVEITGQLTALISTAAADTGDTNNTVEYLVARFPIGVEPVDPVDPNDPGDPADPNDPNDPADPNDPPAGGGGGGGSLGVGLLAMLPLVTRFRWFRRT